MELGQTLYNIKYYLKLAYDYIYPYAIELYNYLYNLIIENKPLAITIGLIILYLYIKSRGPKVLKKRRYKKIKKQFYNTGIRHESCFYDIIKLKIRLADFCDKKGIRYCYLFQFKLFGLELYKVKYIDQKGRVYKRKVQFRS